jgi:hypothetical protein
MRPQCTAKPEKSKLSIHWKTIKRNFYNTNLLQHLILSPKFSWIRAHTEWSSEDLIEFSWCEIVLKTLLWSIMVLSNTIAEAGHTRSHGRGQSSGQNAESNSAWTWLIHQYQEHNQIEHGFNIMFIKPQQERQSLNKSFKSFSTKLLIHQFQRN